VIGELGARVLGDDGPVQWSTLSDHDEIRRMIAAVVPGYGAIDDIGQTKQEFQIDGRIFHEPVFATANGRCRVHAIAPPAPALVESNQVRIATVRSEGQFNTVVYEEHDFYRGQERRDVILLNVDDMRRMGIDDGQRVRVQTKTGSMEVLARTYDVAVGNAAMYYPEANAIVPRTIDPSSRTPAFKGVVGTITLV
jgi:anaerobic selenocysteine-containing dehydrogenase